MNKNKIIGNWTQLKGKAHKQWGKLTNDALDETEGRYEEVTGLIQKTYGISKEQAEKEVDSFLNAA